MGVGIGRSLAYAPRRMLWLVAFLFAFVLLGGVIYLAAQLLSGSAGGLDNGSVRAGALEPLERVALSGVVATELLEPAETTPLRFGPAPTAAPDLMLDSAMVQPTVAFVRKTLPTAAPSPTPPPSPLATVGPTDERLIGLSSAVLATPTPLPFQVRVPGTDVRLRRQAVFMSQVTQVPGFWPVSENVFYERTARHIGWMVDLDYTHEDSDFEMTGLMRWLNVTGGAEHVIFQQEYTLDADAAGNALFFMMGNDAPGFWNAGDYRLELWDNRDRLAVFYEFTVKSGVVR